MKSKSLIRVTRNADIDADALYDEDLDYREFMADLMKKRRRLAPVRLELSRALDDEIIGALCEALEIELPAVFRNNTPWTCPFLFQLQGAATAPGAVLSQAGAPEIGPVPARGAVMPQDPGEGQAALLPL